MFQFPGLSSRALCVRARDAWTAPCGFAHSEIRGSQGMCPSPRLIAACRVLRRLPVPRHPPCARDIFPSLGRALATFAPSSAPRLVSRPAPAGRSIESWAPLVGAPGCRIPHPLSGARSDLSQFLMNHKSKMIFHSLFKKMENRSGPMPLGHRPFSCYAALRVRGVDPRGPDTARMLPGQNRPGALRRETVLSIEYLSSSSRSLPRKEVIQPHLPVRLPCYDFTPLALHTFDASPHRWSGPRLRVQTTRVV